MTEPVAIDPVRIEALLDALRGIAGRLPGCAPVRSYPTMPAPGQQVVDAAWALGECVERALDEARTSCQTAAALPS